MIRPRVLAALASACLALTACASTTPNLNPVGETFPSVSGNTLAGEAVALPKDLAGQPAILLVAFVQDAQFDVDRWLLGLLQARLSARIYEVPTVEGFVPTVLSGVIDDGMRSGIPEEDWGAVLTVYEDGGQIVAFTGNEGPRNTRVILLDSAGRVAWFHDAGYSARLVLEIERELAKLREQDAPPAAEPTPPTEPAAE